MYEGMRQAVVSDVKGLKELVRPLEKVGTLIERSEEEIRDDIRSFTVVEREGKIIGCCLLKLLGNGMGEVSAFVVQEQFRTEHRGDALLDYVEQKAKSMGMKGLVLLTTRTGDWFVARGFERRGTAHLAHLVLPPERISTIDPQRKSILFVKVLDAEMIGPPGSRIGY
jgi:amino-acid N-acetyltransferase